VFRLLYHYYFLYIYHVLVNIDDYYKKLSCRRDSTGRLSLRRSRSFKVTYFGTDRKPACDFLLVNSNNLHTILHCLPDIVQYWSNYRVWQGVPLFLSLTNSFAGTPENIVISHIFSALHFCRRQYGSLFRHFYVVGPKSAEFDKITKNEGYYTI